MMKKSQILAAIALAMALGVVAPVVNANAATQGDATLTTNSQKAANTAVKEVKQSFATINTRDTDGDIDEVYTGAAAYGFIASNATTLSDAIDYVANAEKAGGDISNAFKSKVAGYVTDAGAGDIYASVKAIDDVMDLFRSADDWDNADLATAKGTAAKVITLIDKAAKEETNQTTKAELQTISHNLQEVVTNAEIQKLVDADVVAGDAAGDFDDLKTLYGKLTGETAGTISTESKLNNIITGVKNGIGSANWSKYLRVHKLVKNIEDGLKDGSANDVTLDRWVEQLKGATNGTGETPVTPDTNAKDDVNAPATGIAGTAEGTATTVSIVAGLATALTALGAGVVAYRSARRK